MKKILILIIAIISVSLTGLFFFKGNQSDLSDFSFNEVAAAVLIDESTSLECSKCNPKSSLSEACLNCQLENVVYLKSGASLEGRIINITDNSVKVKVKYGDMIVKKSEIDFKQEIQSSSLNTEQRPLNLLKIRKAESENTSPGIESSSLPEKSEMKKSKPLSKKKRMKMFYKVLRKHKWIAYNPSEYKPGNESDLTEESIRQDLKLLKALKFTGLISYSSKGILSKIPELAKASGFDAVIMGVWDPVDDEEIASAINMSEYADAYSIGNEGIHFERYSRKDVISAMETVKDQTNLPVTTSEPLDILLNPGYRKVWKECDWIFAIAHFIFDEKLKTKDPEKGVRWLAKMESAIKNKLRTNKLIMFKEAGFPSGGADWASEQKQKIFFDLIESRDIVFSYFEAFDQSWKTTLSIEPYWGLFKSDRTPKEFVREF